MSLRSRLRLPLATIESRRLIVIVVVGKKRKKRCMVLTNALRQMKPFRGLCAACGKSWNSNAFKKSRPQGYDLPAVEERMLDFRSKSETNNRICERCNKKNGRLLKAKRAREEEENRDRSADVASNQLKPDCQNEQDETGGGEEKEKYVRTSRGIVRDADAAVGDVGALDVDSSEEEEDEVEGDAVLMLLFLAASNV